MSEIDEIAPHPFARLTPDAVMDAVESLGLHADGRLSTLNSYENRVYQIGIEDAPAIVAKFYRPERWSNAQILEEHAFVEELAVEEIPVVPALSISGTSLHHHGGFEFALFTRHGGRAPELEDRATLEWMGRFLGRIHTVGARRDFLERPSLNVETFGREPRAWLIANAFIPPDLRPAWESVSAQALDAVQRAFDRVPGTRQLRLHGDCHPGNVLWRDEGPHFVDFDDSRTGPAIQDLWMLLSGDRADMARQLREVLSGYKDFCDFDDSELILIEPLRTLRLLHYSAWIARRWDDPAFPAAFPWFNTQRYWQDRVLELREQVALMDEPALWGQLPN